MADEDLFALWSVFDSKIEQGTPNSDVDSYAQVWWSAPRMPPPPLYTTIVTTKTFFMSGVPSFESDENRSRGVSNPERDKERQIASSIFFATILHIFLIPNITN